VSVVLGVGEPPLGGGEAALGGGGGVLGLGRTRKGTFRTQTQKRHTGDVRSVAGVSGSLFVLFRFSSSSASSSSLRFDQRQAADEAGEGDGQDGLGLDEAGQGGGRTLSACPSQHAGEARLGAAEGKNKHPCTNKWALGLDR